jgi:hypothetical protein
MNPDKLDYLDSRRGLLPLGCACCEFPEWLRRGSLLYRNGLTRQDFDYGSAIIGAHRLGVFRH